MSEIVKYTMLATYCAWVFGFPPYMLWRLYKDVVAVPEYEAAPVPIMLRVIMIPISKTSPLQEVVQGYQYNARLWAAVAFGLMIFWAVIDGATGNVPGPFR